MIKNTPGRMKLFALAKSFFTKTRYSSYKINERMTRKGVSKYAIAFMFRMNC